MEIQKSSVEEALTRQVQEILPSKEGLAKLMQEKKIRVYFGVDPTAPDLHLGHVIPLRKLRQFQELGHEVILLFGTFTAQVGDPTGKDKMRQPLSEKQIKENMAAYRAQASKILDFSKVKIKFNADWLKKLNFSDTLRLASHITVARLLERDMFQERIKKGDEIWAHELLYPLMQGYDSVAMNVDLEIGGNDQLFNMLVGRKLQKDYNNKEKFVLATPLLLGLDGRKMSKTYGNTVNILDAPNDMYGKIMTLKDDLIPHYFELCTKISFLSAHLMKRWFERDIKGDTSGFEPIEQELGIKIDEKTFRKDFKKKLAFEITKQYHGERAAQKAEKEFIRVFQEHQQPENIVEVRLDTKEMSLLELLVAVKFADSKSDARRLVEQKGVKIDGIVQTDPNGAVSLKEGAVIQAGPRRFVRLA